MFIQYDYSGECLNIQVGSGRRIGFVIILTENTITFKQNMIVMMLIISDNYAAVIWNNPVGAYMKRSCVFILIENIVFLMITMLEMMCVYLI